MIVNLTVILLLISITMSGITASLIIGDINTGNNNAAHTQTIINHKIDIISNQTRGDAEILAMIDNITATHEHKILEQINSTINHTKMK